LFASSWGLPLFVETTMRFDQDTHSPRVAGTEGACKATGVPAAACPELSHLRCWQVRAVLQHLPDERPMRLLEPNGLRGCADQAGGGPTGVHAAGHLVTRAARNPKLQILQRQNSGSANGSCTSSLTEAGRIHRIAGSLRARKEGTGCGHWVSSRRRLPSEAGRSPSVDNRESS